MIFVTVGTHEQPFDRLIVCIDNLVEKGVIKEEIIVQTGWSTYEPKHCTWSKLFPYNEMVQMVSKARIVITHGGPSSFIQALQVGKIPIVVPRKYDFAEHVNNHQVEFCNAVADKMKNIIVVENIEQLGEKIKNYEAIVANMGIGMTSNNANFCSVFEHLVDEVMKR